MPKPKNIDWENNKKIGERVALARLRLGFNQKQFAERLQRTETAVGNRERGSVEIEVFFLMAIHHQFGVSMDWLLYGKGEMIDIKYSISLDTLKTDYNLDDDTMKLIQFIVECPLEMRKLICSINNKYKDLAKYYMDKKSRE